MLSFVVMTGCPSEFGREGRIAKAIHQDTVDMVIKSCSDERRAEVCGHGKEQSRACLECGGNKK